MTEIGPFAFLGFLGLCLGSFAATSALRLEQGTSLWGRSRCDQCHKPVSPLGLFPVLGFLILKGRCPQCNYKIPPVYPLTELLAGALAIGLAFVYGPQIEAVRWLFLGLGLLVISWLDFRTTQIYTGPILVLIGIQSLWLGMLAPQSLISCLIGLLAGAGLFHWVSTAFLALRGKEGLGQGDASLLGLLGFLFGWQALLPLVFLSAFSGLLISLALLGLQRKSLSSKVPFGPYLVLAAVLYQAAPQLWGQLFHLY